MHHEQPVVVSPSGSMQPMPANVIYLQTAPPRPERMSVSGVIIVLLFSGLAGALFAARHHSIWGSIWRGWLMNGVVIAILVIIATMIGAR
jgi:hypothetical protein